jgi:hypothetical protein
MRIGIKLIIIFLFFTLNLFATEQGTDIIIYQGDTLAFYSKSYSSTKNCLQLSPLLDYKDLTTKLFKEESCESTGYYRGFIGCWTIKENKLYLKDLLKPCDHSFDSKYELNKFFKLNSENLLFADWFTGELILLKGEYFYYGKYLPLMEWNVFTEEIILYIENGVLISTQQFEKEHQENIILIEELSILMSPLPNEFSELKIYENKNNLFFINNKDNTQLNIIINDYISMSFS